MAYEFIEVERSGRVFPTTTPKIVGISRITPICDRPVKAVKCKENENG